MHRVVMIVAVAIAGLALGAMVAWGLISLALAALAVLFVALAWKLWPRHRRGRSGTTVARTPDE